MKTTEYRVDGVVLAIESAAGDVIAQGLLDDTIRLSLRDDPAVPHLMIETMSELPSPAALILVPCPFVIDCCGDEGQMACGDCDPPLESRKDAMKRGWRNIEFDPFALGASYLGTCPHCQRLAKVKPSLVEQA